MGVRGHAGCRRVLMRWTWSLPCHVLELSRAPGRDETVTRAQNAERCACLAGGSGPPRRVRRGFSEEAQFGVQFKDVPMRSSLDRKGGELKSIQRRGDDECKVAISGETCTRRCTGLKVPSKEVSGWA